MSVDFCKLSKSEQGLNSQTTDAELEIVRCCSFLRSNGDTCSKVSCCSRRNAFRWLICMESGLLSCCENSVMWWYVTTILMQEDWQEMIKRCLDVLMQVFIASRGLTVSMFYVEWAEPFHTGLVGRFQGGGVSSATNSTFIHVNHLFMEIVVSRHLRQRWTLSLVSQ